MTLSLESSLLAWQLVAVKGAWVLHRFDESVLKKAEADVRSSWPANVYAVVDTEGPFEDPFLTDCLWNSAGRLVISLRLKECLSDSSVSDVEYLPLKIIDRTGRVLNPAFFLIHFRNAPDCLDLDASGAVRSRAIASKAESIERLAFKHDPERALFRPSAYNKVTLLSWSLAETLAERGFTGMRFMGLFDFGIKGDLPPNPKRSAVDTLCARLSKKAGSHERVI